MSRVANVNTTNIADAIHLGCRTMQSVFNADDEDRPFFKSVVYPEAFLAYHSGHAESHVPGRHLNALLNAQDIVDIELDESAIEKHRNAAFFSHSGAAPLSLNREVVEGPLVNFSPHNLREGLHALYALVKYRDDAEAFEMAQRRIASVLDLWSADRGWDEPRLERMGLNYMPCVDFVHGEARMMGPLVKLYRATGYAPALDLALVLKDKAISEYYLADGAYDSPDRFTTTHSHSIYLRDVVVGATGGPARRRCPAAESQGVLRQRPVGDAGSAWLITGKSVGRQHRRRGDEQLR